MPLNGTEDINNLKDWLTNVWTNLAMVNYPYSANFLAPLPAYPVKVSLTNSCITCTNFAGQFILTLFYIGSV